MLLRSRQETYFAIYSVKRRAKLEQDLPGERQHVAKLLSLSLSVPRFLFAPSTRQGNIYARPGCRVGGVLHVASCKRDKMLEMKWSWFRDRNEVVEISRLQSRLHASMLKARLKLFRSQFVCYAVDLNSQRLCMAFPLIGCAFRPERHVLHLKFIYS